MSTSKPKTTRTKKDPAVLRRQADPFLARESERYAEPLPSREYIEQILAEQGVPTDSDTLCGLLAVTPDEREAFERRLGAMERAGQVMRNRRGDFLLPDKASLVRGRVEGHPDGFGFIVPDDGSDHLFLGPKSMREVLHGDRVLARISGTDQRGRPEGRIVEVLERANTRIVGRVVIEQGIAFVLPENRRINQDILLAPDGKTKPQAGQVVSVELTTQPSAYSQPIGRIVETLGNYADDGMEIEIALRKHDLPHEFPAAVKSEAEALPDTVGKKDWAGREDITGLPLVTIDGETAKDFDDAVYCEKQGRGWRLLVAIADVSHYVQPGAPLDAEALSRGTSVYFPRRVIPMLPEKISNGLCSLNAKVERLCMVCDMDISATGAIKKYRFYPAVMFSHARLTYNRVAAALYEKDAAERERMGPLLPHLENLDGLFQVLLKARAKRGAIDFETVETRMIFTEQGKIERIVPEHRNDAHRVIEECMLAANVCASDYLAKNEHPTLYRVHERPTAEKMEKLRTFLAEFGLTLGGGDEPHASDFARVVDAIRGRPDAQLIQTVMLRSLRQAVYSPDNLGHFGLAYDAYAHFTSPIRRYPDLLVHRAIKAVLSNKRYTPKVSMDDLLKDTRPPKRGKSGEPAREVVKKEIKRPAGDGLWEAIGVHCSATERRADEASRDVETWLKCFYMQDHVNEEYSGSITSVTAFGIFVTLDDLFVEGLVHISDLGTDYFHFDETRHELLGERTGQRFRLSERVRVQVVRVNLEQRKIDFRLAAATQAVGFRSGKTQRDQAKDETPRKGVRAERPARSEQVSRSGKPARAERAMQVEAPAPAKPQAERPAKAPTAPPPNAKRAPQKAALFQPKHGNPAQASTAQEDDGVLGWRDLAGIPPGSVPALPVAGKGKRSTGAPGGDTRAKSGQGKSGKAAKPALTTAKAGPKPVSVRAKGAASTSSARKPVATSGSKPKNNNASAGVRGKGKRNG